MNMHCAWNADSAHQKGGGSIMLRPVMSLAENQHHEKATSYGKQVWTHFQRNGGLFGTHDQFMSEWEREKITIEGYRKMPKAGMGNHSPESPLDVTISGTTLDRKFNLENWKTTKGWPHAMREEDRPVHSALT